MIVSSVYPGRSWAFEQPLREILELFSPNKVATAAGGAPQDQGDVQCHLTDTISPQCRHHHRFKGCGVLLSPEDVSMTIHALPLWWLPGISLRTMPRSRCKITRITGKNNKGKVRYVRIRCYGASSALGYMIETDLWACSELRNRRCTGDAASNEIELSRARTGGLLSSDNFRYSQALIKMQYT